MRNPLSLFGLLALSASVLAQETPPNPDFDPMSVPESWKQYDAGSTLRLQWQVKPDFRDDMVSLQLIGGATQNTQVPIPSEKSPDFQNSQGYYDWYFNPSLGDKNVYGFIISSTTKKGVYQYSFPFTIRGGSKPESSGSASVSEMNSNTDSETDSETTSLTATSTQITTLFLSTLSQSNPASYPTPSVSVPVRNTTAASSSCDCSTVVRVRPVSSMVVLTSATPVASVSRLSMPTSALGNAAANITPGASASAMPPQVQPGSATTHVVKTASLALLVGLVLAILA